MNLVERIKGILLQPKSEWPAIEGEPGGLDLIDNEIPCPRGAKGSGCSMYWIAVTRAKGLFGSYRESLGSARSSRTPRGDPSRRA